MSQQGWMSMEEAVAHVMRVRKCSRHKAMKLLAKQVKRGKIGMKREPIKNPLVPLSPQEAVERLDDNPEEVFVLSLAQLVNEVGFTKAEALGELRAGRLRASASDSTFFAAEVGAGFDAHAFLISAKALTLWMANPKTPPHLLAKLHAFMDRKPS
jgi:hypothetical protein